MDGHCYAHEFFDDNPKCQKAFLAQAMQMAITGRLGKMPQNGHQLRDEFADLFEFKPGDFRFIGFRYTEYFYVTNGAPKKSDRKQLEDYRIGLQCREEFFFELSA